MRRRRPFETGTCIHGTHTHKSTCMIIRREGRPLPGSTSLCIPEINEGFFWQQSVPGEPFLPPLKKVPPKASLHNRETCLWRPWLIGRRLLKGWWTTLAAAQGCRFGALCGCQKYPKPSPDHPLGPCHTPAPTTHRWCTIFSLILGRLD